MKKDTTLTKANTKSKGCRVIALLLSAMLILAGCSSGDDSGFERKEQDAVTPEAKTETVPDNNVTPSPEPSEASADTLTAPDGVEQVIDYEGKILWDMKDNAHVLLNCDMITFSDYDITIPAEWKGLVYANTNNDSVSFYQASSYDYYPDSPGMGFIMGFSKHNEMVFSFAGECVRAYTPDMIYYTNEPTDVPYIYDDEAISEEYRMLAGYMQEIASNWKINEKDVKYDAGEYIFANSENMIIPSEVLCDFTYSALRRGKNEIYARHNAMIEDTIDFNYFRSLSWYTFEMEKWPNDVESELNDVERKNIAVLEQAMEDYSKEKPLPKQVQSGRKISAVLNEDVGTVDVLVNLAEADSTITINKTSYKLTDIPGVELSNVETSYYYVTKINPYIEDEQIAIVNHGTDNDYVLFFGQESDGSLILLGVVNGYPFDDGTYSYNGKGFNGMGRVDGDRYSNLLGLFRIYEPYWFNSADMTISQEGYEGAIFEVVPTFPFIPSQNITGYKNADGSGEFTLEKDNGYYFIATDDMSYIMVRDGKGETGYFKVTKDMTENPEKYFYEADI